MTVCNVRSVAVSDEPTENYHPTLLIASFNLFICLAATLLFTVITLAVLFSATARSFFQRKSSKIHSTPPTYHQMAN